MSSSNRRTGIASQCIPVGLPRHLIPTACALLFLGSFGHAQNLPAVLGSATYAATTVTNCSAVNPPSGCAAVSLGGSANAQIIATQSVVLGQNFTAVATPTSSLTITIVPALPTVSQVVTSSPAGLQIVVDGASYTTPQTFTWTTGSSHAVSAAAQSGGSGVQYVQPSWSDGGAAAHNVIASAGTLTATFGTQYYLTTAANPPTGGTISPASEWVNAGTPVTVSASAAPGYTFAGFSGGVTGSFTMNAPASVTANFTPSYTVTVTPVANSLGTSIAMAGGTGANYTVALTLPGGFTDSVTIAPQLPPGFQTSFTTSAGTVSGSVTLNATTSQAAMTITAPAGAVGNVAVGVTATDPTSGVVVAASGGVLAVQDFTMQLTPTYTNSSWGLALASGGSGAWTLVIQGLNGFNQAVDVTQPGNYRAGQIPTVANQCPNVPSYSIDGGPATSEMSVLPGQPVQVNITAPIAVLNAVICGVVVGGTAGGIGHDALGALAVNPNPDFALLPVTRQSASPGGIATYSLGYTPQAGFTSPVTFTASGLPPGITASGGSPATPPTASQMQLAVAPGVTAGPYQFTVTAAAVVPAGCTPNTSGCTTLTHPEYAWITVQSGGTTFSLSANPPSQNVQPGGTAQYTINIGGNAVGSVTLTGLSNVGTVLVNGSASTTVPVGGSATVAVAIPAGAAGSVSAVSIVGALNRVQHRVAPQFIIGDGGGGDDPGPEIALVDGDTDDSYHRMVAGVAESVTVTGTGFGPSGGGADQGGSIYIDGIGVDANWDPNGDEIDVSGTMTFEAGPHTVEVITLDGGIAVANFEVDSPSTPALPAVTGINPTLANVGQQNIGITITGTEFVGDAGTVNGVAFMNGVNPDLAMTFVIASGPTDNGDGTSNIQGNLSIGPNATAGVRYIQLSTDQGYSSAASTVNPFTVNVDPISITSIDPNSFAAGVQGVPVAITGTGFPANPTLSIDGNGVTWTLDPANPPTTTTIYALFSVATNAGPTENVSVSVPTPNYQSFQSGKAAQQGSNSVPISVTSSNVHLVVTTTQGNNNSVPVTPGQCLSIDSTPHMPPLTAQIVDQSGAPATGTASWYGVRFDFNELVYDRTAKPPTPSTTIQPLSSVAAPVGPPGLVDASAPWSPIWMFSPDTAAYFGGDQATINWNYNGAAQAPFKFCILGTNASQSTVQATIPQLGQYWFEVNVATHETQFSQFFDGTSRTNGGGCTGQPKPTGEPICGDPAGYGTMQLDPPPTMASLWNWQQNIRDGDALLRSLAGPPVDTSDATGKGNDTRAYPFWIRQAKQWTLYNNGQAAANAAPVPAPETTDPKTYSSPNCNFVASLNNQMAANGSTPTGTLSVPYAGAAVNTYWYGDAVLMKQLSGAPTNYISWNNTNPLVAPSWSFTKQNSVSPDIVYEFCTCTTLSACIHHIQQ